MSKNIFSFNKSKNIDEILSNIFPNKGNSQVLFFILAILYTAASVLVAKTAGSHAIINFLGIKIPFSAFTGVFSTLANIFLIFLAVLYFKIGYFTSLVFLFLQLPLLFMGMMKRQNPNNIAGLFNNISTLLVITIIYINNLRINRYQEKMRKIAITDALTELPNRYAYTELISELINKRERFAVVSIDLVNFKNINDTLGHEFGDKVLIEISNRWKNLANSRKTGTIEFVSRLGGDEYSLIIRGYNSCLDIMNTVNTYEAELERKITIDDCDCFVTACFGYAEYPDDASTTTALFSCSDAALHQAQKSNNSSRILRYNSDLLQSEKMMEIERKLRIALDNDNILCYLQPLYSISHQLCGFEALARLKDIDGTLVHPSSFIPVAEKTGLIDKVDIMVFKKAAAFLAQILKTGKTDIVISVNVSVRHLMKNNCVEEIKEILKKSGVPAKHFKIEITESIMIDSDEKALNRINEIKNLGMQIAIDDFGTGYSSLSYLQKFPADMLKIDKSFIDVMNSSEASQKYVASIISIGHILNLEVISEGVESTDQLETLQNIGCDYIQGYIWGKPMPLEEAGKLFNA